MLGYTAMMRDEIRTRAYVEAIRRAITPGCTVLDIGTGTGVFAVLAGMLGAGRVFAIEPSDAIRLGPGLAAANGCADKVEFIQDVSTAVELPTRADVIVSDLRSVLPLFEQHIPSIVDARKRLLAPGGVLVPQRDTLWAAPVEAPEQYARHAGPRAIAGYALDLSAIQAVGTNTWSRAHLRPENLLAAPASVRALDYATIQDPNISAEVSWTTARAGVAHGVSVWFDAELHDGVGFSNAPSTRELLYGSAFFPLREAVGVQEGDRIAVTLRAHLVGSDYIWRWETRITEGATPHRTRALHKQSTLLGSTPLSAQALRQMADSYVPVLGEDGQVDRLILSLMDGKAALGDIARCVMNEFPARYVRWQDALTRVSVMAGQYNRAM